jgi:hypothetical protein
VAVTSRQLQPVDDDLSPVRRGRGAEVALQIHGATYVLVNLFLVGVWLATGAHYFWPIWPIMGWGLALALQGWFTYGLRRS